MKLRVRKLWRWSMSEVHARELGKLVMAEGNESKYSIVIDEGTVKEWVGIGWIELRTATEADSLDYPTVVRGQRND